MMVFKKFGYCSFGYCTALNSIVIPNSITSIDEDAFYESSTNFTIYAYSEDAYAVAFAKEHNIPYRIINQGDEDAIINSTDIKDKTIGNTKIIAGIGEGFTASSLRADNYFNDKTVKFVNAAGKELADTDKIGTGTVVKITDSNGTTTEKTIIIYGDTNGDGLINAIDALAIVKNKAGTIKFTNDVFAEAGRIISSSGTPSAVDALAIIKHKNGKYSINQSK